MNQLPGKAIKKKALELYGTTGEFTVLKTFSESPIKVKYFQTVASTNKVQRSGDSHLLLDELKPMRERVESKDIKDLRALLQRDLSDARVANDLIPYLQGHNSSVGFFPAILVALIPSKYLESDSEIDYPKGSVSDDQESTDYDSFWGTKNFKIEDTLTSLGVLTIDVRKTSIIVLDGQHRANAFRYLAGSFNDATDDSTIYSAFYQNCNKPQPDDFDAELPVTVVWFDGDDTSITPELISRKLFVDVNTTATKVSENRNILLNDRELASIATTSFYSVLAQNSYSTTSVSLMHAGFDCEGENFPADYPKMSLFSPKTIHYMLSYFLQSNSRYLALNYKINSDVYRQFGSEISRIKDLSSGKFTDKLAKALKSGDSSALDKVTDIFQKEIAEKLIKTLNEFNFLKPHFTACTELQKHMDHDADGSEFGTWNKVFKGGEGLYNAFIIPENNGGKIGTYKSTVDKINKRFIDKRSGGDDRYSQAINSFVSQAGFTGFFMALLKCEQSDGWSDEFINNFVLTINKYDVDKWVTILVDYKSIVVPELSPKLWPLMRAVYLRFIEEKSIDWDFSFSGSEVQDYNTDYIFCKNTIDKKIKAWNINNDNTAPDIKVTNKWAVDALDKLESVLTSVSITLSNKQSIQSKLESYIESKWDVED